MMEITGDDVGPFIGMLLAAVVRNRGMDLGRDLTDEQFRAQRLELYGQAFDELLEVAAEPLKSKLRASREAWLTHWLALN